MRRVNTAAWIALTAMILLVVALAVPSTVSVEVLLETDNTVLGEPFAYPAGKAEITAVIVTVPPGTDLPGHAHPVPTFGYVLQGELTVDYGAAGERTYRKGDALVEAFNSTHRARNAGSGKSEILVVYAGAVGVPNSVAVDAP